MQQSYEEIKKNHPDEWLILGNPVMDDSKQEILAAELLYHSSDRFTLSTMDKPLLSNEFRDRVKLVRYNHVHVPPQKVHMIAGGRTIPGTFKPISKNQDAVSI